MNNHCSLLHKSVLTCILCVCVIISFTFPRIRYDFFFYLNLGWGWNLDRANYILPLCLIVICLNSTLPNCNSQPTFLFTENHYQVYSWCQPAWSLIHFFYFLTALQSSESIYFISHMAYQSRTCFNNNMSLLHRALHLYNIGLIVVIVIIKANILGRLKVNPQIFLLQQIQTLWWALWKCTRDVPSPSQVDRLAKSKSQNPGFL